MKKYRKMTAVDWSQVPDDLLIRIVEDHLQHVEEFVIFSRVCQSWHNAAYGCNKHKLRNTWRYQMPWLMLTDNSFNNIVYCDPQSEYYFFRNDGFFEDMDECNDRNEYVIMRDHDETINRDNIDLNDFLYVNDFLYADDFFRNDEDYDYYDSVSDEQKQEGMKDLFMVRSMKNMNVNYRRRVLDLRWNREKKYDLYLPEAYDKACWGTPYGWIVTLGLDRCMELLNPLTKARLPLPSQLTLRYPWRSAKPKLIQSIYVRKVVLLQIMGSTDTDWSWLVVIFHRKSSVVSIAKPGDESWKEILIQEKLCGYRMHDVQYNSDLHSLMFVNRWGDLYHCDISDMQRRPLLMKTLVEFPDEDDPPYIRRNIPTSYYTTQMYIVQSGSGLLALERILNYTPQSRFEYQTTGFRVYKLNLVTCEWEGELHDLNGTAFFVGNNTTFSIPATRLTGFRGNCIYFNDDNRTRYYMTTTHDIRVGHDIGVFDMADKTIHPLLNNYTNTQSSYCSPLWFSPAI